MKLLIEIRLWKGTERLAELLDKEIRAGLKSTDYRHEMNVNPSGISW